MKEDIGKFTALAKTVIGMQKYFNQLQQFVKKEVDKELQYDINSFIIRFGIINIELAKYIEEKITTATKQEILTEEFYLIMEAAFKETK